MVDNGSMLQKPMWWVLRPLEAIRPKRGFMNRESESEEKAYSVLLSDVLCPSCSTTTPELLCTVHIRDAVLVEKSKHFTMT